MARDGPAAHSPVLIFHSFFSSGISTDLHRVWAFNMDDGEFEFGYHLIIRIIWQCTSPLSSSVNRRINREWQRFSLNNKQRTRGSKRIQMINKMVIEFKLTVVNFARPNQMQICVCACIYRWTKKLRKSGLGHRAAGPSCLSFPQWQSSSALSYQPQHPTIPLFALTKG